ncbi:MAG: hypothetical protein AAF827_18725, partial [Cyanobacteria bacterium P01_D01_bin.6]
EMSDVVKDYPEVRWDLPGLRPLQVSLILAVVATSLAGILSNPLFTLANNSISHTPLLQASIAQNTKLSQVTTDAVAMGTSDMPNATAQR